MKRSWISAIAVAVVIGLLTLFLGLQYRWLFLASDAERDRMQKRVETDTARFAEDFNREMQAAYFNFQTGSKAWKDGDWREFNERYDYWKSRTSYPELIRDIIFVARDDGDTALGYDKTVRAFTPVVLTDELKGLRERFANEKTFKPVYDDAFAMVLPIYEEEKPRERVIIKRLPGLERPAMPMPEAYGWLVVMVDRDVVTSRLLPDLTTRYFPENNFKVGVVDSDKNPVAAAAIDGEADASATLFDLSPDNLLFFTNREILPLSGQKHDVVINQRVESHTFTARMHDREEAKGETFKLELEAPNGDGKPRTAMFASTAGDRSPWVMNVQHTAGSIDEYVRGERNKSFFVGLGLYLLLVGAILAIVLSALRSKRFAQRQIDFVSSVSHEFRTPLAVIYSAGENLADGVAKAEGQVARYGELIKSEGKKLSGMVEQILEFAGANSGRRKFSFSDVTVPEIVDAALDECKPLIDTGGFTVESDLAENLPTLSGDKTALSSALQNLISNSLKYSNGSKWIRISARNGDGTVKISVEDRGIGIRGDDLRMIFDPFYRAKDVVDAQISGNGLGLNLVKKIVEAHGGRVSAESRPGVGTKFTIELPQK